VEEIRETSRGKGSPKGAHKTPGAQPRKCGKTKGRNQSLGAQNFLRAHSKGGNKEEDVEGRKILRKILFPQGPNQGI